MSTTTLNLTPALYDYWQHISVREDRVLTELREATVKLPGAQMQISPEQGQFMAFLIQILQAKKVLEVGTFTGYSALVMALALPKAGELITCDIDSQVTGIAHQYWVKGGVADRITLKLAPAQETLKLLIEAGAGNTFDFIFIDGDKKSYDIYYEYSLKLIRSGGIIAIDNVFQGGRVTEKNADNKTTLAIQQLNRKIYEDRRVNLTVVPLSDGLTLVTKK